MKKLLPWFAVLVLLIVAFATLYGVVQQSQRSDANYPQIQLAEDAASALNHGDTPYVITQGNVDVSTSLAPFMIIYNKSGRVVSSSGYLNGQVPKAPIGILSAAMGKNYHAVTWQPEHGIRIAAVSVAAKDYYVLEGRSLKEVEKNESTTLQLSLIGGIAALILLGLVFVLSGLTEDY